MKFLVMLILLVVKMGDRVYAECSGLTKSNSRLYVCVKSTYANNIFNEINHSQLLGSR